MDKNTSHLAGEFLVAGELARRQLNVSLTFGNAKSIDIYAESRTKTYRIDTKAVRTKSNWPISTAQIKRDVIYVFVYLGSDRAIRTNNAPEFFVVKGAKLLSKGLISSWGGGRSGVTYQSMKGSAHENAWRLFK